MNTLCRRLIAFASIATSVLVPASLAFAEIQGGKGVGPVQELKLEALDSKLAAKGKGIFTSTCASCHKFDERYVGPMLKDVTTRRHPEWIMNMMLNPQEMIQKDETAAKLLEEFLVPMTFQNINQDDARAVLEYFRSYDSGEEAKADAAAKAAAAKAVPAKGKKKSK